MLPPHNPEWHGPTPCCQSTPGFFPCQRSVHKREFRELGRGRWGKRSLGGSVDRLGRWRRQDEVLPPGQAHHGGEQGEGVEAGRISAYMCTACVGMRATRRTA